MVMRLTAGLAAILLLSSAAQAGVGEDLTAAIRKCAAIADAATRHACYDQLPTLLKDPAPAANAAPPAAAPPSAPPPVAAQPSAPPPVAAKPSAPAPVAAQPDASVPVAAQPNASPAGEDKGFLSDVFGNEPVPADHIAAAVESFTYDSGLFVVTLDNGQVWAQVAALGGLVRFSREKKDHVAIWRSDFGYDVLKIEGRHTTYHVRRIR